MICNEVKVRDALGLYLFNTLSLGGYTLPRGHQLNETDLMILKQNRVETIFAAQRQDGDIDYKTALGEVAAKLCGKNTAYSIGEDGICRIISTINGVLMFNEERVAKFNRHGSFFILNTIYPYKIVEADTVIAELELNLPIIPQEMVDEMLYSLSGNEALLSMHDISSKKVGLMYTRLTGNRQETKHFTDIVKRLVKDFPHMDLEFGSEFEAPHAEEEIANILERALKADIDVLFLLPAQQTRCPHDIIIKALQSVCDEIVCSYLPQVGAGDFIVAAKKEKRVIVVPYNYGNIDSSYAVRYIKQAIVADKINAFDFDHPQNFIIKEEQKIVAENAAHYITSGNFAENSGQAHIAAIVLAAGRGARCNQNKLLTEINGEPLFMRALNAAIRSKASPVFLITGYQADEMEEYLDKTDVNILYNSGYRSGIKTSITLGLKSVPNFCNGAILIPADMPEITEDHLNKMIDAFQKDKGKQVIISGYEGVKTNPILWSKELYDVADIVPENAHLRTVFAEHADYTQTIDFSSANQTTDITYPLDLENYMKKQEQKK